MVVVEDLELSHLVTGRPKIVQAQCDWRCRQSCLSGDRLLVTILLNAIRLHSSCITL